MLRAPPGHVARRLWPGGRMSFCISCTSCSRDAGRAPPQGGSMGGLSRDVAPLTPPVVRSAWKLENNRGRGGAGNVRGAPGLARNDCQACPLQMQALCSSNDDSPGHQPFWSHVIMQTKQDPQARPCVVSAAAQGARLRHGRGRGWLVAAARRGRARTRIPSDAPAPAPCSLWLPRPASPAPSPPPRPWPPASPPPSPPPAASSRRTPSHPLGLRNACRGRDRISFSL